MSDVRKALEAAADAIYRDMFPERYGLAMETDAELRAHYYRAGRAAFLAGLKALPDWSETSGYREIVNVPSTLAAAVEKEAQP